MADDSGLVHILRDGVDKTADALSADADVNMSYLGLQCVLQFLYDAAYALVCLVYIIYHAFPNECGSLFGCDGENGDASVNFLLCGNAGNL